MVMKLGAGIDDMDNDHYTETCNEMEQYIDTGYARAMYSDNENGDGY